MKKLLISTGSMVGAAIIVFVAFQAIMVELVDDFVERDATTSFSQLALSNFILMGYQLVLFTAFILAEILTFRSKKSLIVALLSACLAFVVMSMISGAGLYSQGIALTPDSLGLLFVLYMIYVVRGPGTFTTIEAITFVASSFVLNLMMEVDE